MSHAYTERFDDACAFALEAFRPVWRKGAPIPYITHLFSVTALVGEFGGTEDQLIAAMLHDALEDIEHIDEALLTARFGATVCELVVALSDSIGQPRPPWRARKVDYLAKVAHSPPEVNLISAADKLHNCRTVIMDHHRIGDAIFERFTGRRDGTLWYYREMASALRVGWTSPLLDLLDAEVRQLHALAREPWPVEPLAMR